MGFFKDISTLNKMGKEIRKDYDPVSQMAQAQLSMVHANAALAEMTQRATTATALHGRPTTATVTALRETGQYLNMQPMIAIDLLVLMPGGLPSPVTITEVVAATHLAHLQVGRSLAVKVGATPEQVTVDWFRIGQL
jgi:hypothetical protein